MAPQGKIFNSKVLGGPSANEYLQYDLSNQLANTQAIMFQGQNQYRNGSKKQFMNSTAPINIAAALRSSSNNSGSQQQ